MPTKNVPQKQFDFLRDYVEEILHQGGFNNLNEETKKEFLPRFVAQAELRLGAALLPLLSEAAAKEMAGMIEKQAVNPDQWLSFWQKNIKDFNNVVEKTLRDFAVEVQAAVNSL